MTQVDLLFTLSHDWLNTQDDFEVYVREAQTQTFPLLPEPTEKTSPSQSLSQEGQFLILCLMLE